MLVYIHNKCSTCQNALHFLQEKQIAFTSKNIVENPPSIQELQQMLDYQNGNIKKLLNTSGLLYREMQLGEKLKEMSIQEILLLLSQHGMLIKRPFLLGDHFGILGYKELCNSNFQ